MVDFRRLKSRSAKRLPIEPREIFQRLPRAGGVNDFHASQAEVMAEWFRRRTETDLVIKLLTGGGKTLVGLLIARSMLNERHLPVAYLVPTRQLVEQIVREAQKHGLSAVPYLGKALPKDFLAAESIGVATYAAVFNGRSKFGIRGGTSEIIQLGGIILDDAHAAFDVVRDTFTFTVPRHSHEEMYREICPPFRASFREIDRAGTYDDILAGRDGTVLEVPYWVWLEKAPEIATVLSQVSEDVDGWS